ncbi:FxSxx-COOH system tetratricopeptide repeat protein [Streptomyces sp. IMTB 2501]|uniref:FxSxx-COOH system tetratricopeptide repeat protein n=1 Tax=Streptomyces sp. IMTB 2501 TaxID=1776340 RepID=UPI002116C5B9|nr:FxSxx-COOH system tetratricopeptide repeat protein [Streptomyces sp. IMTB 2501]
MSDQPPKINGREAAGGPSRASAAAASAVPVGELHPREIADALWLAACHPDIAAWAGDEGDPPEHAPPTARPPRQAPNPAPAEQQTPPPRFPQWPADRDLLAPRTDRKTPAEDIRRGRTNGDHRPTEPDPLPFLPLTDDLPAPGDTGTVRPIRALRPRPDPPLPHLARALRPLRRQTPNPRAPQVDTDATAERLAVDPGLPPAMRPGPGPRWHAVLLLDVAPRMAVWRDTTEHAARLFRQYGGFGDFRLLHLDTSRPESVSVHWPGTAHGISPGRLLDPTGRTLVLVLTDGLAPAWQSGAVQAHLASWGRHQPTAVLNVLPQHLWYRSALHRLERVRLHTAGDRPGPGSWEYAEPSGRTPAHRTDTVVPVLELSEEWLLPWTTFLTGTGPRWTEVAALLLPRTSRPPAESVRAPREKTAAERVALFRVWASPDTFQLATRLATAPLDLRVMTALQRRTLPRTGPEHLAEFLMSDLVTSDPADDGFFSFHPGVREEVLAASNRHATELATKAVAELLAPRSAAAREMLAYLDGATASKPKVTEENRRLREIEFAVLRSLSGAHARRARLIGQLIRAHEESTQQMSESTRGERPIAPHTESYGIVTEPNTSEAPVLAEQLGHADTGTSPGDATMVTAYPDTGSRQGITLSRPAPLATVRPMVWGNMPPRNLVFTGREDLLQRLERELRGGPTAVLPHALHGLGGVGKSQLAQEYVYRQAGQYDIVWWIPAERPTQIAQALVELAHRLHLPVSSEAITAVPAVLEALRTGNPYSKWLLVFDNAESPEAVQEFFPSSSENNSGGSILITSRNPQWNTLARPLEVDVFERAESIQLLQRRNPDLSDDEADQLAHVLGDLPLAVEQASAWRAETGMPAAEYLRLFAEKRAELMTVSRPTHYEQTVATAWNVSLDHLASKNPAALQLLQICAYFAPEPIARSLFSGAPVQPIAPDLDRALTDPLRLARAIREINRYSLAKIDHRNNSIQMHRLVQAVLIARMTEEQQQRMRHGAHLLLAANAPRDPRDPDHWGRFGDLYPHVVESGAIDSEVGNVRQLIINTADYLYYWGDHESAREFGQKAYERWREKYGEGDQQTLLLCRSLWYVLWRMGRYGEAAELSQRMLTAVRALGSDAEEELLSTMGSVAVDRRSHGDFRGALDIAREVHERAVRAYGEEDPLTLDHTHNLAVALRACGHYREALELDEETWRRNVVIYGEEAYDTLLSEMGLALDRREAGDYALGARMFEEIVEKYRNVFGETNPHTLRALARLAVSRRKAGDHQAAYDLSLQASKALTDRYGERSPDSLVASLSLSIDLRQLNNLDDALKLGERTRDLYAEVFGSQHPDTVAADIDLAITLRLVNQVEDARALNENALDRAVRALGEDHPTVLVCAANLASDRYAQGDAAGALELGLRTLERVKATLGEQHPTAFALMNNIASDLRALRRTEEAEAMHTAAVEGLRSKLGAVHPACTDAEAWRRSNCDADPMP